MSEQSTNEKVKLKILNGEKGIELFIKVYAYTRDVK